ncbi:MAG: diacylglycerol kinase family lipid kinase [Bacteroidales bacterium]|nr:diacylglycerol kinase family lipid kinase [Bacteroidales bacterium]
MKHVFVVNPCAGGKDCGDDIAVALSQLNIDSEIYETTAPRDATRFVAQWCDDHPGVAVRFYACGGDGTLNEVVSGAVGHDCEVACYPCGSGNDYVKCWPEHDFSDIKALAEGSSQPVDILRLTVAGESRYCVNVMNFGFEAEVCRTMELVRRVPLLGGKMAYITGIVHCLLHKRHNPCRIFVDGEAWHSGDMLLGSAANGRYVGGGFKCAPRALVDDGWLEAQCVDALSIPRFLRMIGHYKRGEHLDRPDMHDVVHYRRARRMTFDSDREFSIVLDGELMRGRHFEVEILHRALRFALPDLRS